MNGIKLIYTLKNITLALHLKVILSKVVSELSSKLSHYQVTSLFLPFLLHIASSSFWTVNHSFIHMFNVQGACSVACHGCWRHSKTMTGTVPVLVELGVQQKRETVDKGPVWASAYEATGRSAFQRKCLKSWPQPNKRSQVWAKNQAKGVADIKVWDMAQRSQMSGAYKSEGRSTR